MSTTPRRPLFLLAGRPKARPRANRADPLLQQAMRACGKEHPSVGYLGSASGDDRDFFKMISALLRDAGAGEVLLAPTAAPNADLGKARDILATADAILVSGGDVEEGMQVLGEKNLTAMVRAQSERGVVFIGLSAGSIMLARQWVRWRDPNDDSSAELFDCMALAPVLCDTHGEADAWEELVALLRLASPGAIGYGIPSGAGLCVTPEGRLLAMGDPVHRMANRHGAVTRIADLGPEDAA